MRLRRGECVVQVMKRTLLLVGLLGVVACGTAPESVYVPDRLGAGGSSGASRSSGDGGAGGDGGSSNALDAYCESYASAYCNKAAGCMPFQLALVYADVAACEASNTTQCKERVRARGASMPNAACPAALAAESCDEFAADRGQVDACNVRGTHAVGGPCAYGEQCATGACRIVTDGCGSCVKTVAEGGACSNGEHCAAGLFCTNVDPASATLRCARWRGRNEACGPDLPSCAPTLSCSTSGTCVDAGQNGGACGETGPSCDMLKGLYCALSDAGTGGSCRPATLGKAGHACSFPASECGAGAICSSSQGGTCLAPLPLGAACAADAGPRCARPGSCNLGRCAVSNPACL